MSATKIKAIAWGTTGNAVEPEDVKRSTNLHLLKVISTFCEESSVHGLGQVVKNTVTSAKIVWLVVFVAAVIANAYHVSTLVKLYFRYPIQEVTKTQRVPVPFPDVTICNLDAISKSNRELMEQNNSSRLSQYLARIQKFNDSGVITEEEFDRFNTIIQIAINIGAREIKAIGHQLQDFVLKCSFRGMPCNTTNHFKWVMNAILFNCYTFDPGSFGDNVIATGPENGLSLILYIEADNGTTIQDEYDDMLNSANALGVKLMLHPTHSYPIPHIDGMDIMPGHSTSIAFKVTHTERLPPPYGDCISNESLQGMEGYDYTTTPCLNMCLQRRLINNCRCKSIYQPIPDDEHDDIYCGTLIDGDDSLNRYVGEVDFHRTHTHARTHTHTHAQTHKRMHAHTNISTHTHQQECMRRAQQQ